MKAKLKELALKLLLPRIYDGRVLARYLSDEILAEALFFKEFMQFRPQPSLLDERVLVNGDPVRYAMLATAINRLNMQGVKGSFAEVGVWRGKTSAILHHLAPDRLLYLFDSFEGFSPHEQDSRFQNTSEQEVMANIGDSRNVVIVKGFVPATFRGHENEKFSFVVLDVDKFEATAASLEFFYPRLVAGGYMFLHDYNAPESDWGVKRAVDGYMRGRQDIMIDIPDRWGSLMLCKVKA